MTETISPVFLTGLAIVIVALGLGVYSTYTSFKNARGPRERAFLLASSLACWTLVMVVLLSELFLPNPFSYYMLIAVLFAAPVVGYVVDRQLRKIRRAENIRELRADESAKQPCD
jgi:peptidoglycan/LPS O-acetylase OafA/YrhL